MLSFRHPDHARGCATWRTQILWGATRWRVAAMRRPWGSITGGDGRAQRKIREECPSRLPPLPEHKARYSGEPGRLLAVAVTAAFLMLSATVALAAQPEQKNESGWKRLQPTADGETWVPSQFGGDGPIEIGRDVVKLGRGDPLTGVRYPGDFPRENYEIRLEARRTEGIDFFCGLTFPVGDERCSLILGGWAGFLSGFSTIDGFDASENETTREGHYDNDRWYKIRVRVTEERVTGYVDGEKLFDAPREGHSFDVRAEVIPSLPLGVAVFQSDAEFRNFRYRRLDGADSRTGNDDGK